MVSTLYLGLVGSRWNALSTTAQIGLVGAFVVLQVFVFGLAQGARALVTRFQSRAGPGALGKPASLVLAGACLAAYWLDNTLLVGLYPRLHWGLALGYVGAGQLLVWCLFQRRPPPFKIRYRSIAALAMVGLACFLALGEMGRSSKAIQFAALQRTVLHGKLVSLLRATADSDGDGYATILGGGDCNDANSAIHPGAVDLPENGVDEDCSGADLTLEDLSPPEPGAGDTFAARDLNVVLITIDAVRADHLGVYGYDRATSPRLDDFARQALVFDRAYAQSNDTGTSMPSLITGRYPSNSAWSYGERCDNTEWQAHTPNWPTLPDPDNHTLAELLGAKGYATGIVTAVHNLLLNGISQGFAEQQRASSENAFELAQAFVNAHAKERFFLWLHADRPHAPYQHHAEHDFGKRDIDRYDSEIAKTDVELGAFFEQLRALGIDDETLVILSSDHGEEFREHGGSYHTTTLYEELVHVPLIMRIPGVPPARIAAPTDLVNVVPTVARVIGFDTPGALDGVSLLPLVRRPESLAYSERLHCGVVEMKALISSEWKLIDNVTDHTLELYHLSSDPVEKRNLIDDEREVAKRMGGQLDSFSMRKDLRLLALARRNGDQEKLQLAKNLGHSHNPELLIDAAAVIVKATDGAAAPYLASVASRAHAPVAVRGAMLDALAVLPGDAPVRSLLVLATHEDSAVAASARDALSRRTDGDRVGRLRKARDLLDAATKATSIADELRLYTEALAEDPTNSTISAELAMLRVVTEAKVRIETTTAIASMKARAKPTVVVKLTNDSDFVVAGFWQKQFPDFTYLVAEWQRDGTDERIEGGSRKIPWLKSKANARAVVPVTAPSTPGDYTLVLFLRYRGRRFEVSKATNELRLAITIE